jgi:hypothetical protein
VDAVALGSRHAPIFDGGRAAQGRQNNRGAPRPTGRSKKALSLRGAASISFGVVVLSPSKTFRGEDLWRLRVVTIAENQKVEHRPTSRERCRWGIQTAQPSAASRNAIGPLMCGSMRKRRRRSIAAKGFFAFLPLQLKSGSSPSPNSDLDTTEN